MRRSVTTGFILVLVCAAILLAGCQKSALTKDTAAHPGPAPAKSISQATIFAYECGDGLTFVARIEGETAWLFLPTGTVSLPHVPSASGAKFAEGEIALWSKGEEAMLEVDQGGRRNCRNNRAMAIWGDAKFRGADFRAVGNEPGWNLKISAGGSISFIGDYGQTDYRFSTPEPSVDQAARRTTYTVEDAEHDLVIVLEARRCQDTMSAEFFETRLPSAPQ